MPLNLLTIELSLLSFLTLHGVIDSSIIVQAQNDPPSASQDIDTCFECEWDYEPRVWVHEQTLSSSSVSGSSNFFDEVGEVNSQEPEIRSRFVGDVKESDDDPRESLNYLPEGHIVQSNPRRQGGDRKCTQFRVDTREAIVCDKKRCDKFKFEWPTYDNQLVLIQTTKHGMRFNRQDLAFEKTQDTAKKNCERDFRPGTSGEEEERVKFDLLDLFKPKPPTSTAAPSMASSTTTTQSPASSTTTQTKTTTPATSSTTTNTPGNGDSEGSKSTTRRPDNNDNKDKPGGSGTCDGHRASNCTKLVTTFRLSTRRKRQRMVGFGGALSDSTCRNIKSLSPKMADCLMDDYYGESGLRYNLARLSIGSSDFSITPYTNNDKDSGASSNRQINEGDDVEMNNFRLTSEDYDFKMPVARQAIATSHQEIKFMASLWSPPTWMKNNSHIVHGYLKGDVYGPYYKALAELMIKWLEAYRKNGLEFWILTILNEIVTGVKPFIFHNSIGMARDDYIKFIKLYLGPMIRRRGFEDLKLFMLDDNKGHAPNWVRTLFNDPEASKYIAGAAFHWYLNDEYENLNFIPKDFPEKMIISSEASNGFLPFQVHAMPGDWDRGVAYMYDILRMVQKGSSAWVDWNMALDLTGGPSWAKNNLDAAVIVNSRLDEYYKSPMFYAIGHFSKFVARNSTRLDYRLQNANYDYPLEAVGFLTPDEYIVIVALNANHHPVPFKVVVDGRLIRVVTLRSQSFSTLVFRWKVSKKSR